MILETKTAARLRLRLLAGSVLAGLGIAAPAAAQEITDQEAIRFGIRESVLHISLSPSGKRIAYISAGPQHTEILYVVDFEGDLTPRKIATNSEIIADLDSCSWANDVQLVCQVSGMLKLSDGVPLPVDRSRQATRTVRPAPSRPRSRCSTGRSISTSTCATRATWPRR